MRRRSLAPLLALPVALGLDARASAQPRPEVVVKASSTPVAHIRIDKKGAVVKEELPPSDVRMWLGEPTTDGLWTMRIDNTGPHPARVPADIRVLHIEVDEPAEGHHRAVTYKCELPPGLRLNAFPDRRAVLLAQGESYVESFDPHLFCFGKNADALKGGNVVRAYLGWPAKGRSNTGPWAVEATQDPLPFANAKTLTAPTGVLSYDHEPGASWMFDAWIAPNAPPPDRPPPLPTEPPTRETGVDHYTPAREARIAAAAGNRRRWDAPVNVIEHPEIPKPKPKQVEDEPWSHVVDENAPRLAIEIAPFIEASAPAHIPFSVRATNVGKRPMLVVIRPRMFSIDLEGPDGTRRCDADQSTGAVSRESFRTMKPGDSVSMTYLLGEICPIEVFSRPGLYRIQATLVANENGANVGLAAYTGESVSQTAYIRLATAPDPFYATMPHPIPTDWLGR